ncbi:MAG TPA: TraR/DksA family transcriptional regulator [Thermodesulfobacteriota bacterium]|nr:TraR/DksA family transcriptional regulator [Thermodesulfobacteriota bacterium]
MKTKKDKRQRATKNTPPKTKKSSTDKKKESRKKEGGKLLKQAEKKSAKRKSDWRDEVYEMLLQMRKDLLRDVSQSIKQESDHLRFDVGDFYDHASNDRDRELALVLTDREREKLQRVEDALKRIEEGTYGICEVCGDEIDKDRLMVMPFTKLCLSCQEDLERQRE